MDRKRKAILFLLTETPTWVYDEMVTEWVHPINNERETFGEFQHLYKELRMDEDRFKTYFRMSVSSFEYVLGLVKDDILKQNTAFRDAISPEKRLALTLR